MKDELTMDPLLEDAMHSFQRGMMLLRFVRDSLRNPILLKSDTQEINDITDALDEAFDAATYAFAKTGDAGAMLSMFLRRKSKKGKKEEKDE